MWWKMKIILFFSDFRFSLFECRNRRDADAFWLSEGTILRWIYDGEIFPFVAFVSKAWGRRQHALNPG